MLQVSDELPEYFRAHLSAAPLKASPAKMLRFPPSLFPRSPERGPIEGFSVHHADRAGRHFRAHLSAAPLKDRQRCDGAIRGTGFPRSPERGPIEGTLIRYSQKTPDIPFPRSPERGPIEGKAEFAEAER